VFRNDPEEVVVWWKELLETEGYIRCFDKIVFAILERSGKNMQPFVRLFG